MPAASGVARHMVRVPSGNPTPLVRATPGAAPVQHMTTVSFAFQSGVRGALIPAGEAKWDAFVTAVKSLVEREAPCADLTNQAAIDAAKEAMPAVVPARFDAGEESRKAANVRGSTIIGCDIDGAPPEAWAGAVAKCAGMSIVVHTSPTDGLKPGVRKGRIFALADRELGPAEIWPARVALAEHLGVRPWLDEATKDASRIFFAGRLQGTPPREFVAYSGAPVPTGALFARYGGAPAAAPAKPATSSPSAPLIWTAGAEHEQKMTAAIVALLAPEYDRGGRHAKARALGAVLAQAGWSYEAIAELVEALPSDKPTVRAEQAVEAAKRAAEGEPVPQRKALEAAFGARLAGHVIELAKQPAVAELEALAKVEASRPAYQVRKVGDIGTAMPPIDWLYERLRIAPGAPTLVAGYGGLGKSMFVQLLVACIITGKPCFAAPVRRGRVLHLDYEQGPYEVESRYKRIGAGLGLRGSDLVNGLDWLSPPPFNLTTGGVEGLLIDVCKHYDVVVIDSFRAATPGLNENDSEIRAPLDLLFRVSVATGCVFIVIHHARKANKDNADAGNQNMRGNGAINDAAQAVIMLEGLDNGFRIAPGKVRIGRKFDPLDVEVLDADVEGVPYQALQLVPVDTAARAAQAAALQTGDDAIDDRDVLAFLSAQPAGRFKGSARTVFETMPVNARPRRPRIEAALERLIGRRMVEHSRGTYIVTPGTPGVVLDARGTPIGAP